MSKIDYKTSGVNIELGDDASKIMYEAAKLTWENRKGKLGEVVEIFSDFSGLRAINVGGLPENTYMNIGFDGVGTKVELAERTGKHDTVAFDLFAMVCDDAVIRGAEPVIMGSILDVNSLGTDKNSNIDCVRQLAKGYVAAAKEANVAVINGEIAELGAMVNGYGDFNYSWGSGLVWFAKKERMFTGYDIKVGDKLIGLEEKGFRANGLSLVRKILSTTYGQEWHAETYKNKNIGELVLHPSRIYSKALCDMFGGFNGEETVKINGAAHITGGGIPGKLGRILQPSGYGAYINEAYDPCDLMLHVQEKGEVSDVEAYKTWNMGQGMIVVASDADTVIRIAKKNGINAKVIGEVKEEKGVVIKSKGIYSGGEDVIF